MQRRSFLKNSTLTVFSISAFGSLNWNGTAFEGDTPTTTDILGPFYRPGSPFRTNLRLPHSNGTPIVLHGRIVKEDGKTPVNNALVEIWHCDEHEVYDNTSAEFKYRGRQKTKEDGRYEFKSILPVPYKAVPGNDMTWRPAHIHMRVSVPGLQDLVTQIYFKGGKYVNTDRWASAPQAINRVLAINQNNAGEREIVFNVTMNREIPLDRRVYERLTGLYDIGDENFIEFTQSDDLLFMKQNGMLTGSLRYIGNNTFEGGVGYPKAIFDLQKDGGVNVVVETEIPAMKTYKGVKMLKYD